MTPNWQAVAKELAEALLDCAHEGQFGPCWCHTVAKIFCVGQPRCVAAKAALAKFTALTAAQEGASAQDSTAHDGVTEEDVDRAWSAYFGDTEIDWPHDFPKPSREIRRRRMRAALESFAAIRAMQEGEDARDARRYRFWRQLRFDSRPKVEIAGHDYERKVDAAIDAAIAAKEKG